MWPFCTATSPFWLLLPLLMGLASGYWAWGFRIRQHREDDDWAWSDTAIGDDIAESSIEAEEPLDLAAFAVDPVSMPGFSALDALPAATSVQSLSLTEMMARLEALTGGPALHLPSDVRDQAENDD